MGAAQPCEADAPTTGACAQSWAGDTSRARPLVLLPRAGAEVLRRDARGQQLPKADAGLCSQAGTVGLIRQRLPGLTRLGGVSGGRLSPTDLGQQQRPLVRRLGQRRRPLVLGCRFGMLTGLRQGVAKEYPDGRGVRAGLVLRGQLLERGDRALVVVLLELHLREEHPCLGPRARSGILICHLLEIALGERKIPASERLLGGQKPPVGVL